MKAKENLSETNQLLTKCDCAILVAVETEFNAVMNCGLSWEVVDKKDDSTLYYRTKTKNGKELILARQHQMGMVAATALTTRIIDNFVPRYFGDDWYNWWNKIRKNGVWRYNCCISFMGLSSGKRYKRRRFGETS